MPLSPTYLDDVRDVLVTAYRHKLKNSPEWLAQIAKEFEYKAADVINKAFGEEGPW